MNKGSAKLRSRATKQRAWAVVVTAGRRRVSAKPVSRPCTRVSPVTGYPGYAGLSWWRAYASVLLYTCLKCEVESRMLAALRPSDGPGDRTTSCGDARWSATGVSVGVGGGLYHAGEGQNLAWFWDWELKICKGVTEVQAWYKQGKRNERALRCGGC